MKKRTKRDTKERREFKNELMFYLDNYHRLRAAHFGKIDEHIAYLVEKLKN
jgi:hypothetical protein